MKTREWFDAAKRPIVKADVDAMIAKDPELKWSASDYVAMRDERTGRSVNYFMIEWNGSSVFWWYLNEISCKNPDASQQVKMVRMARSLGGFVVGDDGERYDLRKSFFGKESLVTIPWPG